MDEQLRERIVSEVSVLVEQVGRDTTAMWATGELVGTSTRARVAGEFRGTQFAPWFEGGRFDADVDTWVDGTSKAAAHYKGSGIVWRTADVVVLPRSEDEAAVSYRVIHEWPDERPPTQALFLETWVRRRGEWVLLRHTAEKA